MQKAPDNVGELMTKDVVTVTSGDEVRAAVQAMIEHDIGAVVVSDAGAPVGMFTERDLTRRIMNDPDLLDRPLREVMTSPVIRARPEDEVVFVFERMNAKGIRRLPIVDGDRLVGIVTERDLLRWVGQVANE